MITLAPRFGAEAAPVAVDHTGPYRLCVGGLAISPAPEGSAEQDAIATALPAWSTLSWEERADYVARYCR